MDREYQIEMASKKELINKLQKELEATKKQYQELRQHTLLKQVYIFIPLLLYYYYY